MPVMRIIATLLFGMFAFAALAVAQQPQDAPGTACVTWRAEWRDAGAGMSRAQAQGFLVRVPARCAATRAAVEARITALSRDQAPPPNPCAQADARWTGGLRNSTERTALQRFINETPSQCIVRDAAQQRLSALPREVVTPPQRNPCDAADATWASLRNSNDVQRLQSFVRDTPASCAARGQAQARITALQQPPSPPPQAIPLPEMVRIPGQNFEVGRYEVTFAQWDACVAAGGCNAYRPNDQDWGRGNRPVINVNWNDAQTYVQWLSTRTGQRFRLLTSAEWEIAARAGSTTNFSWGDQDPVCDQSARNGANFAACTDDRTRPVGSFQANGFGLFDVHGNVWEWVEDAEGSSRVLRGGSWVDGPAFLRSSVRSGSTPTIRNSDVGFRVARTV